MGRKRKASKARRSTLKWVAVWAGRRMLRRVQQQSLRSITEKPGRRAGRTAGAVSALTALKARMPLLPKRTEAVAAPSPERSTVRRDRARKAGKGFAVALLSAAAVAAIKVGVDHVVESEREQQVVTPDFDVFGDDDE